MNTSRFINYHYFVRAAIIMLFALYISGLMKTNAISDYIAPRMFIYVKWSALGLFVIAVQQIYQGFQVLSTKQASCHCDHHPVPIVSSALIYSLFIFPLLLGFLLPDTTMDSFLVNKKGMNLNSYGNFVLNNFENAGKSTSGTGTLGTGTSGTATSGTGTSGTWTSGTESSVTQPSATALPPLQSAENPAPVLTDEQLKLKFKSFKNEENYAILGIILYKQGFIEVNDDRFRETLATVDMYLDNFIGKKIQLSGFIYRPEGAASNQFAISRFLMQCCSADATPIGVLVQSDIANHFADDAWIRVSATVGKTSFQGKQIIKLDAISIQLIPKPEFPYVYPDYSF